ncbi:uncharacterized protein V6R79_020196 [Siganus canaliculatus]
MLLPESTSFHAVKDVDDYRNHRQQCLPQEDSELDFNFFELTEMERRSIELEEDLRRAMAEISSSTRRMQQFGGRFQQLQRRLRRLQADLRTEMEPLNRWSNSINTIELIRNKENQMKRSSPFRVRSLPNLLKPSGLIDVDFEMIKKAKSLNRTILFKKDTLEDFHEFCLREFEDLENMFEDRLQAPPTVNPTQTERQPPHAHPRRRRRQRRRQPAPPTVNPTQTERQPPRAHPRRRRRQPDVDDYGKQKIPFLPQEDSELVNFFEMKRSSAVRVRSLPNILNSSKLIDVDFEIIKEARSLPLPISFKKKDTLEDLENMFEDQRQVFSVMDLTWTGTQDQPLHLRQTLHLHQPAPPTVNPTQTERQPPRAHPPLRLCLRQPAPPTVNPTETERQPPRAHPRRRRRQPAPPTVNPTQTERQHPRAHPPLRQPAPPIVNPTQTERQPPRAHPPQTLRQPVGYEKLLCA